MMPYLSRILALIPTIGLNVVLNAQTSFVDVTEEAGIDHQFVVFEGMFGGGACVFDLNNDGFEDIFITSGMSDDVMYLNNGDGTFKDIYEDSGLEVTRHYVTQGVSGADVNRDGWVDLFVTTITSRDSVKIIPREKNLLLLNNGDLTFRDATSEYGLDQFNSFSTGVSFGDINADGYPDAYVGNYFLAYDGELSTISDATIVGASQASKDYLLLNEGGEHFSDAYEDYGLDQEGFGFGGLFTDFDNDGDQDLFINNDFGYKATPDFLMRNEYPRNSLKDVSKASAMDLKINSMGTAVGDYNGDGLLDYYIPNIKFNWFMENQGNGKPFVNKIKEAGLGAFTTSISWGANFADFDLDGDVDLFVANGDLNPNCRPMVNYYFENDEGHFTNKAHVVGLNHYGIGRGSVVFDIENDGDLDLLVINQKSILDYPVNSTTRLFRNDVSGKNWLKVMLKGQWAESHGLGSRVEVVSAGKKMMREIDGGGSSHLSQNSTIAHFGLGTVTVIDSLIVTWTGGKKQILINQSVNQLVTIVEVEGNHFELIVYVVALSGVLLLLFISYRLFKKFKD